MALEARNELSVGIFEPGDAGAQLVARTPGLLERDVDACALGRRL